MHINGIMVITVAACEVFFGLPLRIIKFERACRSTGHVRQKKFAERNQRACGFTKRKNNH